MGVFLSGGEGHRLGVPRQVVQRVGDGRGVFAGGRWNHRSTLGEGGEGDEAGRPTVLVDGEGEPGRSGQLL